MASDKGKVLLTGGWERMIENLEESLGDNYRMIKCQPNERDFRFAFSQSSPNTVVVCLSDESGEITRLKAAFEGTIGDGETPVIIIGHDEECTRFEQEIPLRHVDRFVRPLDTSTFWATLTRRVGDSRQREQQSLIAPSATATTATETATPQQFTVAPGYDVPAEYTAPEYNLLTPEEQVDEKRLIAQIEKMTTLYGRMRVLVVDDDVRMLNIIKLYLQELYDVTVVPTGRLAAKFLTQKHADMVLLDYLMPEMDGPQVLKFIREESPCQQIPVLFLTGVSDRERIMTVMDHRPNGYLLKPVTRMALLERVTELLLGLH